MIDKTDSGVLDYKRENRMVRRGQGLRMVGALMYIFPEELRKAYEAMPAAVVFDQFFTDPLTGLPNLNYLNRFANDQVRALKDRGKTPVLIYADVISMQSYNSQYGYQKGNELLCQIADCLKAVFPEALIMRGADDHFVLIDAFGSRKETEEKIIAADRTIQQEAEGRTTGIKAGVSVCEAGLEMIALLDRAKIAIKQIGNDLNRVCYFYSHTAEDQYRNQRYVVENFEKALENGWIKVYYQGIARTETGKGTALEALARWVDPVRGVLSPGAFIPTLEKYHLLHKLDLYMAEQVCRDIPLREKRGMALMPVTVNFSAQDFDYADIPAKLLEIYNKYCPELHPERKYLVVEITEQDMAQATERFQEQLRQLKKEGFRIWLDDFGSGYSSLNVFSRFDVDLIKFDMDLLRNLNDRDGANRRIMNAMVQIAREMGIHTLAEGLETEQQRSFLQEIGCELAQGYLFHRPEPLESAFFRLESGEPLHTYETAQEREQQNRKWFEEYEQSLPVIEQFGNHMPSGFFIARADESGELLYANKAAWHILGCETLEEFREFTGFAMRKIVHPEDFERVRARVKEQMTEPQSDSDYEEYRIIRRDGEIRWIDEYSYYVDNKQHNGLYYVFLSDITEKHQKAEADRAMRTAVIEALTRVYDSVWIVDDIETERFELFRIDEELAHLMPAHEAVKITKFSDALKFYSRLVLEEDREKFLEAVTPEMIVKNTRDRLLYSVPFRRVFESGIRYYRLEFARLDLGNGEVNIVAGFRDVDEEVRKDQELRHSLNLRSAVIEALTQVYDSVWLITDLEEQKFELFRVDEELTHMMPAIQAAKITRFSDALVFYSNLILEEDRKPFLEATAADNIMQNTVDRVMYSVPFRRVFESGTRYYRLEFARLDLGNGEVNIVAGFKDVDEEVRKDRQLHQALREAVDLAETDRMTGIYNRITGETRVSDLLRDGKSGMFVLFDIDHFKLFNDRFGHNVGDQVIIAVANCLKNAFRGEDIVMRLGGDEFAAFAAGVHSRNVGEKVLARFYDNLDHAVIREGVEKISVSAGVAFSPEKEEIDFRRLYETADQGMYESKRTRAGKITFCELES